VNRENWTLLAICSAQDKGISPLQLQKSLFLLGKELPREVGRDFYKFIPYNYGPFNSTIYGDAERLSGSGLVTVLYPPGQRWPLYIATPEGIKHAKEVEKKASSDATSYLKKIVNWACSLTFQQLVQTIYRKYPEFRANSVFRN